MAVFAPRKTSKLPPLRNMGYRAWLMDYEPTGPEECA
jgi:hypothetical protein